MTTLAQRPQQQQPQPERKERARPTRRPPTVNRDLAGSARIAALVTAAILPFGRVFVTNEWLLPLLLAGLLPVAISLLARRLGVRWWGVLGAQALGWLWYTALELLPGTLWAGVLPTLESARLLWRVALLGAERVAVLPAPVYPEVPLLILAVAGVWWVAAAVDVLALRLAAPGKAIVCATTLWVVPLAIVPRSDAPWLLAAPLLLAAAAVLLASAERDFSRWGTLVRATPTRRYAGRVRSRQSTGAVLAACAALIGALLAGLLPGFGDPPWYQLRAQATTTLTANPIVQLRTNLVANGQGAVLQVRTPEPVYLRSTALDTYSEGETWGTSGIEPRPLNDGAVPGGRFTPEDREIQVEVVDVSGGVLVPAPIGAVRFQPPQGVRARYDQRLATFTFGDDTLESGQRYSVVASPPQLDAEVAATLDTPAPAYLTELPEQVPEEVGQLARRIVDDANATTPFDQALAIQDELRTWEYSLQPPAGHSGVAMRTFLEQRIGYCEQFASTMAVMLRTLGIPARVAVGFTPGTVDPDDPTLWTVSWSNAHAWVEVKFGGEWIAFEPTPRDDGNVLVPSAANLAPTRTARAPDATGDLGTGSSQTFDLFDEREALRNREPGTLPGGGLIGGGAGQVSDRLTDPTLVGWAVLLAALLVVALIALGRRAVRVDAPAERVLAARERVGRLGHGLGMPAPPWETDREYLQRLASGGRTDRQQQAARQLAAAVDEARYAPAVGETVAVQAEQASTVLSTELLDGLPAWRRALARMRGDAAAGWRKVRTMVRRA